MRYSILTTVLLDTTAQQHTPVGTTPHQLPPGNPTFDYRTRSYPARPPGLVMRFMKRSFWGAAMVVSGKRAGRVLQK